ncbi:PQQ-binding-like beta-propeller repeat protein [Amycolatopsis nalaikhensis]|uniref:PQQ-binding-like beta-propeller repeat protein n=1 Tax=Amycolatopsis nalaikhensis TaxID=715472 RepID=A0ABY8XFL0_9PSEU|nr:PQQ-binding-like beta-propeller repeat protein [Amycolatopsis sp. 2-2]WIV54403.1 PQQ-binding-like beta-propeller repeat protein [Amycolatopsis sp. 2-2]
MASVFRTGVTVLFSAVFLAACTTSPAPRAAPGTAAWAPWPSALHDARHSGASTSDGPTTGRVRWHRKLEGAVTPGPVVGADGTIYAASNGGVLHALDPADGRDRWTYDSGTTDGGDLSISPLLLPGGTVLFPAGAQLVALSPTGRKLWTAKLPGRATSPVTATGDRVYVGDVTGTVTAKGRLYTTADNALVAIDDKGSSSAIAWRADPHDDLVEVSAGLAPDGTALLGTNGHDEGAYRLAYVADHSGTVHVFDVGAGRETGTFGRVGAQIWSSTVVDRAYRLYFGGQNGHAYGFGADGTRLFDVDLGGPVDSYPALTADGALVIGSRDGLLTTIG